MQELIAAKPADLLSTYFRKALPFHPDVADDKEKASQRFWQLSEAYWRLAACSSVVPQDFSEQAILELWLREFAFEEPGLELPALVAKELQMSTALEREQRHYEACTLARGLIPGERLQCAICGFQVRYHQQMREHMGEHEGLRGFWADRAIKLSTQSLCRAGASDDSTFQLSDSSWVQFKGHYRTNFERENADATDLTSLIAFKQMRSNRQQPCSCRHRKANEHNDGASWAMALSHRRVAPVEAQRGKPGRGNPAGADQPCAQKLIASVSSKPQEKVLRIRRERAAIRAAIKEEEKEEAIFPATQTIKTFRCFLLPHITSLSSSAQAERQAAAKAAKEKQQGLDRRNEKRRLRRKQLKEEAPRSTSTQPQSHAVPAAAAPAAEDIYGTKCIFFCYAILVGLNVLVIQLFIHDSPGGPETKEPQVSLRQWLQTLLKFEPMWMLTNLLIYGVLVALIENFLNVFIVQDFDHAPKVILGAATAAKQLHDAIEKMTEDTERLEAEEKIYTIIDPEKGQKSFKGKAVCAVGQKLKDFMAKFNLTDGLHGDLELDELDCHDQRYAYDLETAASICTEPFASFRT
eukprot:s3477_g4.t2